MATRTTTVTAGRFFAVFAHPDDETFLAGGTIARHAIEGWDVRLMSLTRGEAGLRGSHVDLSPQEFGALREDELRAACATLGVRQVQVLGLPDKGVSLRETDAFEAVTRILESWRPSVVLTFGPDGISGHGDHVAASRVVTAAVRHVVEQDAQTPSAGAVAPTLYYVARSPAVPGCCQSPDAAPAPPITTIVDVSGAAHRKTLARGAYRSQPHLQAAALAASQDHATPEMFHRAHPAWTSGATETVRSLPARRSSEAAPDVRAASWAGDPSSGVGRQEG